MNNPLAKFQSLLRELFQFDSADLDFGIYRIMNHKREIIERFIGEDLPQAIAEELERGALAEQAHATQALEAAREKALDALGDDALDAEGNLAVKYSDTKAGKEYLAAQTQAAGARDHRALEAAIYNHLYAFFSRYYQDGDFISKRRYSKRERYAIPYNGEEVTLYWANHDQYYIKTAEHFTDYTYQAPNGVTARFKLQAADVEQNNVKGEKRFFLPRPDGIAWDDTTGELLIPFEYRPLTPQEAITYGKRKQQEAIIAEALEKIPRRLAKSPRALAALSAERRKTAKGEPVSYLEHHLRRYTRRNTSDFFIHKDLAGFLARELDFYLKNEVLNLEELEAAGEDLAEGWFQLLRLIKRVGKRIIAFLAQIENFQKMLWEKRKFVTETFYCITVGQIAETFYPEIADCEAQWDEWRALGFVGSTPGYADVPSASSAKKSPSSPQPSQSSHKGWHSRGYLPHFDAEDTIQFITFRLHDSVPASVIEQWKQELHWRKGLSADSKEAVALRKKIEKYADSGMGACYLRDERIAELVQNALKHFDGERYRLIAWCVMPNHVHVLIETMGHSLSDIMHSWKSFTAHKANKILGKSGLFWMPDYFDRFIRDERHFAATVEYIRQNPVKAGLVDEPEEWLWSGWVERGGVERGRPAREPRIALLKAHPTLVLDTRHFDRDPSTGSGQGFVDRLLGSFDDLDEMTDGLLVHGENWQALNLLGERYREEVKCIHIDPPYNTQTSGFLYKNDYQHSSWLAMIHNRIAAGIPLLLADGAFLCHIDENEYEVLHLLFTNIGISDGGTIIWNKKNPMLGRKGVATQHEYVLWRTWDDSPIYLRPVNVKKILTKVKSLIQQYGGVTEQVRQEFAAWIRMCDVLSGGERAYRFADDDGRVFQSVAMGAPEPRTDPKFHVPLLHPVTKKPCPVPSNGWSRTPENLQKLAARGEILFGPDETVQPRKKVFLKEDSKRQLSSVISDASRGKMDVEKLDLEFPYCHPVSLYQELTGAGAPDSSDIVLDFFAGSGTTGHAVINLNREDGGRRRFILVEMAGYFDTVLLPRIKKVAFSPEWKDGKPKRMATAKEAGRGPRIIKVVRLESYEDALNNIAFDEASGQQALQFDDYLLRYMLKWETRRSETLLNVEKLARPFSYQLRIHRDGETRVRPVDLPETFNYLLGLRVRTRRVYSDVGCSGRDDREPSRVYSDVGRRDRDDREPGRLGTQSSRLQYLVYRGVTRQGRKTAVIWRETEGWKKEDYERDKQFVAEHKLTAGADEIYVNGDALIPGARALEGLFKARMFAEVEV